MNFRPHIWHFACRDGIKWCDPHSGMWWKRRSHEYVVFSIRECWVGIFVSSFLEGRAPLLSYGVLRVELVANYFTVSSLYFCFWFLYKFGG